MSAEGSMLQYVIYAIVSICQRIFVKDVLCEQVQHMDFCG